jgi:hypothetical protein
VINEDKKLDNIVHANNGCDELISDKGLNDKLEVCELIPNLFHGLMFMR